MEKGKTRGKYRGRQESKGKIRKRSAEKRSLPVFKMDFCAIIPNIAPAITETVPSDCSSILQILYFPKTLGNYIYIVYYWFTYWVMLLCYFSLGFSDKTSFGNIQALKQISYTYFNRSYYSFWVPKIPVTQSQILHPFLHLPATAAWVPAAALLL